LLSDEATRFTTSEFLVSHSVTDSLLLMMLPLVYSRVVCHRETLTHRQDKKENADNPLHTFDS
jgi:hypothetical protein